MTALEIILILIGIAFIVVSFFVEEKLTQKDIERMEQLSEKELSILVDKKMKEAEQQIEDALAEKIEESTETTKRELEKETNEKIMSIDEFSNTVIENMNKTHNEIVFLYSMLNDKHTELTDFANQMQRFTENIRRTERDVLVNLEDASERLDQKLQNKERKETQPEVLAEPKEEPVVEQMQQATPSEAENHNEKILVLHKEGMSEVEIAKTLGLGLGEVRLVLGLYKEEVTDAI